MRKGGIFWRLMTFWREETDLAQNRIGFWLRGKKRQEEQGGGYSLFFGGREKAASPSLLSWAKNREAEEAEAAESLWQRAAGVFVAVAQKKRAEPPEWTMQERRTELQCREKETKENRQRSLLGGTEVFAEQRGMEPFDKGQSTPLRQREAADLPSVRRFLLTKRGNEKRQEKPERVASEQVTPETRTQEGQREEERKTEQELEGLMRQMARKLREERESCGRRLYR